ncbi:hypothetical protein HOLleu_14529 [Holothuria leucospilota]|uniref:Uncharacterized protein n=1 Tax=Holothuria leucospilota TaxID=206669 RepID=A0A9Q1HCF2_HOLLE|nr:hypothetical protein HOLleu_14529 [Holothuria leucospilota]
MSTAPRMKEKMGGLRKRGLLKAPKALTVQSMRLFLAWTNPVPEIPVKETQEVEIPMQPIKLKKGQEI